MNRLKLLAAAMLLMVPIACGDPIDPPPPTGSIDGLVSIEGDTKDWDFQTIVSIYIRSLLMIRS